MGGCAEASTQEQGFLGQVPLLKHRGDRMSKLSPLCHELEVLTPLVMAAQPAPSPLAKIPQPARVSEPEVSAFEIISVSGWS